MIKSRKNMLRILLAMVVAMLMFSTMFTMRTVSADEPEPSTNPTSWTIGDYTFTGRGGEEHAYTQTENGISIQETGWMQMIVTTIDTGTQNYYYKLTYKGDTAYSIGEGEAIRYGFIMHSDTTITDWSKNHLSAFLYWQRDGIEPTRTTVDNVNICDSFKDNPWTDNWLSFNTTGAGAYHSDDEITVEVYKNHGETTDDYGIVINGVTYTYSTTTTHYYEGTTHQIGFYIQHENAPSTVNTVEITNFTTSLDGEATITLDSACPTSGVINKEITLPTGKITGKYSNEKAIKAPTVKFGGEDVTVTDNKFTPTVAGDYVVTYEDTDKYGAKATKTETITVSEAGYTIKYDSNGGSGTMVDTEAGIGQDVTLPTCGFTKTNYKFLGWATTAEGEKVYDDQAVVKDLATSNEEVTLYAVWDIDVYTVKFDSNGGIGTMDDLTVNVGVETELTGNSFTRENYNFKGWSTTAEGVKEYDDFAKVTDLVAKGEEVTLYAVWEEKTPTTYTIKFDANGGTGTMADLVANVGANKTLTANKFEKEGYTFAGWALDKDATEAKYNDKAKVKNIADPGKSVTLYAVWTADNGGTTGEDGAKSGGCGGATDVSSIVLSVLLVGLAFVVINNKRAKKSDN